MEVIFCSALVAPCVVIVSPKLIVKSASIVPLVSGSCCPISCVCSWLSTSAIVPTVDIVMPKMLVK